MKSDKELTAKNVRQMMPLNNVRHEKMLLKM